MFFNTSAPRRYETVKWQSTIHQRINRKPQKINQLLINSVSKPPGFLALVTVLSKFYVRKISTIHGYRLFLSLACVCSVTPSTSIPLPEKEIFIRHMSYLTSSPDFHSVSTLKIPDTKSDNYTNQSPARCDAPEIAPSGAH